MSLLSTIGKDIKGVFAWLGSAKGQQVIAAGEGIVESVYPAATGALNLANSWLTEIIKSEAIAAAAGAQDGTGVQKAAIAISAMTPQVLAFAQSQGLPAPDAAHVQAANDALVAFLAALGQQKAA